MTPPRVLMISKPVGPPWNDSGKNIVRDVARYGTRYTYHVLTARGAEPPGPRCVVEPIYGDLGRDGAAYTPGLAQNLRVLMRLLRPDSSDIHHYFFAPNPRTSTVARLVTAVRGRPTVQTVSSSPASYEGVERLCFGDRVVVLSGYNRRKLEQAGVRGVVHVPPGIPVPALRGPQDRAATRARYGLPTDRPVVLFAGDYQFSSAATVLADAIPRVLSGRAAHFVYACRIKQEASRAIEAVVRETILAAGVAGSVTFLNEVDDMEALIAASDLSTMPSESLYAKMDLPLVLLECLAQQVPLVVADVEPLVEVLGGCTEWGRAVAPKDPGALAAALVELLDAPERLRAMGEAGRRAVAARWSAEAMAAAYEDIYDEVRS